MTSALTSRSLDILDAIRQRRDADAPTHGGRVLSYVYDSGLAELDELAAEAIRIMQPVNGLDPTTFPSVASMERDIVRFARNMLHGDENVVGSVTSGGTESCLLAVKTARDLWRTAGGVGVPRIIAPITVHAAFAKAAHYFGVELDLVSVAPDGQVNPGHLQARFGPDVALVVVSAPAYPHASLDPVATVAAAAQTAGIPCHVDACIGGWVLPWWTDRGAALGPWDFTVPGVTSISADLHKYGYAPKGASVLLHRGRDRHRAQYFATKRWPGYPVVNPTILGSKSAGALAAAWAIIERLGEDGFAELAATCQRATDAVAQAINACDGLRVVGSPVGPLLAVATDDSVPPERRVDPHLWADRVRTDGWLLQQQPGITQPDGSRLPHTTHLTITPVTESVLGSLVPALTSAADAVRGLPAARADDVTDQLPDEVRVALGSLLAAPGALGSEEAFAALTALGIGSGDETLPSAMAPLLALIEELPAPLVERLLTELLARLIEP
ncbi:glutamate/tyrosine decarboxylase-like PLP-dependent enzyme [Okibacterium sp. HSC-33S16]|uniref:pyridoxal phosphate-dependent decarboxylase family protein n=1 Tax=Okibacterium sp. HSC-33S16 TaxID=2910965 RepID=UPI0020A050AD|nr:pyridoxal-dependent decarboxylase [Okibacterium sp. HSC-33S16]MCP2031506.1 glutamate/tyrosine decarboxylase-like PLP-dependent enzyme [Okibacterium sp. HSC-33S16]